jgi:hypothetical protein
MRTFWSRVDVRLCTITRAFPVKLSPGVVAGSGSAGIDCPLAFSTRSTRSA